MENQEKYIYFAGPLFTRGEIEFNRKLASEIKFPGYRIFLPQEECAGLEIEDIYHKCIEGLDKSSLVVAILDGSDADSGTSFEVGYAKAKGMPVIGVRTDFRTSCDDGGLNLMLSRGCDTIITAFEDDYIKEILDGLKPYL